jgi:hypothetical protein
METRDLKDFLHLYIGCDVQYPNTDGKLMIAALSGVSRADGVETTYKKKRFKKGEAVGDYLSWRPNGYHNSDATQLKLILRPLSDMTEEEMGEYWSIIGGSPHLFDKDYFMEWLTNGITESGWEEGMIFGSFEAALTTQYLLSKGLDLFDLIPSGLAIDKTTIQKATGI